MALVLEGIPKAVSLPIPARGSSTSAGTRTPPRGSSNGLPANTGVSSSGISERQNGRKKRKRASRFIRRLFYVLNKANTYGDSDLETVMSYIEEHRLKIRSPQNAELEMEESRFGCYVEHKEYLMLKDELREQRRMKAWFRFDLFSGMVVLGNAIVLGMATEDDKLELQPAVVGVEVGFFAFFFVEFFIRLPFNKRGVRRALCDPWTVLDLVSLVFSLFDIVTFWVLSARSGASLFAVVRCIRLLRLIRLVRLLNLFTDLWLLVSGIVASLRLMFWASCMILAIGFVTGMFMYTLVPNPAALGVENSQNWGDVGKCLLATLRIATYDGADIMRDYLKGVVDDNVLAYLIFLGFIAVCSFGILNLIVGVLLTTSMELAGKDAGYFTMIKKLRHHHALRDLRTAVIAHCRQRTDIAELNNCPLVSRDTLLYLVRDTQAVRKSPRTQQHLGEADWALLEDIETFEVTRKKGAKGARDVRLKAFSMGSSAVAAEIPPTTAVLLGSDSKESVDVKPEGMGRSRTSQRKDVAQFRKQAFGITFRDHRCLMDYFEEADINENDINELYNEMASALGHDRPITVDDFIEGCIWIKGDVHALDVDNMMLGIGSVYNRVSRQLDAVSTVAAEITKALDLLTPLVAEFKPQRRDTPELNEEVHQVPGSGAVHRDFEGGAMSKREKEVVHKEQELLSMQERWNKFDAFFSCIVGVNVTLLGIQAATGYTKVRNLLQMSLDSVDTAWFFTEVFFWLVYIAEAFLRLMFHYQMREQHDFRTWLHFFPKQVLFLDLPTCWRILRCCRPLLMQDHYFAFDLTIIVIASVDNLVLRFISAGQGYQDTLRLLGLVRLLRVGRLVRLIRPMRTLASGFVINSRLIFWTFLTLVGLIYVLAIAMVSVVGKAANPGTPGIMILVGNCTYCPELCGNSTKVVVSSMANYSQDLTWAGRSGCGYQLNINKDNVFKNLTSGAVFVITQTPSDPDADIRRSWGHLGDAMLTLMQMTTFNDWTTPIAQVGAQYWWAYPLGLIYVAITGLGLMNLLTGVMVQAAFQVVQKEDSFNNDVKLTSVESEFRRAVEKAYKQLAEDQLLLRKKVRDSVYATVDESSKLQLSAKRQQSNFSRTIVGIKKAKKSSQRSSMHNSEGVSSSDPQSATAGSRETMASDFKSEASNYSIASVLESPSNIKPEIEDDVNAMRLVCGSKEDPRNYCVVKGCVWLSVHEVAVYFESWELRGSFDLNRAPLLSVLKWDGGLCQAVDFFPAESTEDESRSATSTERLGMDDQGAESMMESGKHNMQVPGPKGVLVFKGDFARKHLTFRFGAYYEERSVSPDTGALHRQLAKAAEARRADEYKRLSETGLLSVLDKTGQDTETINFTELQAVLQDTRLNQALDRVHIRPEHVMMVYGQLNIRGEDRLKISDLLQGLLRLKRQTIGVDVARSKSVMRRFIMEMKSLRQQAEGTTKCFMEVVQGLQDVLLYPPEKDELEDVDPRGCWTPRTEKKFKGGTISVGDIEVERANEIFRKKLTNMRRLVEKRKRDLRLSDETMRFFRRDQAEVERAGEDVEDKASVCSAQDNFE